MRAGCSNSDFRRCAILSAVRRIPPLRWFTPTLIPFRVVFRAGIRRTLPQAIPPGGV